MQRCQHRPITDVTAEMGISRACESKRANRYRRHGELGLVNRSSTPRHQPTATSSDVVARIETLRRAEKWTASRIARELQAEGSRSVAAPSDAVVGPPRPGHPLANRLAAVSWKRSARERAPRPRDVPVRGGNSRSGQHCCTGRGTGAARTGNTETKRSSVPTRTGPRVRGKPGHPILGRPLVRLPQTRTEAFPHRRTVS
ncbi:hypothetical protein AV521_43710 [Streptomyces sp. IMTB 2501]|nr:hypothetical protein AV521_43710 [Streptomyces sp. IMTB 2501]